jgi:hypothetical protein
LHYFRSFRDNMLLQNQLGTAFVQWYYRSAPHYANFIYHNQALSFTIKVIAFILYYLFNYWYLFAFFVGVSVISQFLSKKRLVKIRLGYKIK